MKGRLLTTFMVLAMVAVACGESGVVGGDDANQESEAVTDNTDSDNASTSGAPTDDQPTEEEPATEPGEETTSMTSEESPLVTNPPKETPSIATTSPPASGGGTVDPGLLPFVDQAKADLAGRLGVDASAVILISAELVEWSDASLGCPQPGIVYAQVPTDGSLIILSHGGAEYRYHTGGSVYTPFLCE